MRSLTSVPQKLFHEARSLLLLAFSAAPCKQPCHLSQASQSYSLPAAAADDSGAGAATETVCVCVCTCMHAMNVFTTSTETTCFSVFLFFLVFLHALRTRRALAHHSQVLARSLYVEPAMLLPFSPSFVLHLVPPARTHPNFGPAEPIIDPAPAPTTNLTSYFSPHPDPNVIRFHQLVPCLATQ